jgi:hypothetical protein
MGWMDLAPIVIAIVAAIATALAVRGRRPARMSAHRGNRRSDRADPLHRQAAHYRASGALPRWDP